MDPLLAFVVRGTKAIAVAACLKVPSDWGKMQLRDSHAIDRAVGASAQYVISQYSRPQVCYGKMSQNGHTITLDLKRSSNVDQPKCTATTQVRNLGTTLNYARHCFIRLPNASRRLVRHQNKSMSSV